MNWDILEGSWKQLKGKAQTRWSGLTDDQFGVILGQRTELAGNIQERYGIARDEAELELKRFKELHQNHHPRSAS